MLFVTYSQTFKIWGKVQVLLMGNVPGVAEGKLCFSGLCHVFLCFLRATWALWTWVCRESITEIRKTFLPLDAAICSAGKCKSCDGETSQDIFLSEWGLFDWVPVPWSICIKLEDVICNFATVRQDQLCGLAWTLPHLSNKGGGGRGGACWISSAFMEAIPEPLGPGCGHCAKHWCLSAWMWFWVLPRGVRLIQVFWGCWNPQGSTGYVLGSSE